FSLLASKSARGLEDRRSPKAGADGAALDTRSVFESWSQTLSETPLKIEPDHPRKRPTIQLLGAARPSHTSSLSCYVEHEVHGDFVEFGPEIADFDEDFRQRTFWDRLYLQSPRPQRPVKHRRGRRVTHGLRPDLAVQGKQAPQRPTRAR